MSGLKIFALVLLVLPTTGRAVEVSLVSEFAVCAGRFSAEMEHAWLMSDERTNEIVHRRELFIELLNAVVSPDRRRQALNLRIDAKVAHGGLLTQAAFAKDAERSQWAVRRAKSLIDQCTRFLLES